MELELKKQTGKLKFDGVEYNFQFPSIGQIKKLDADMANADAKSVVQTLIDYCASLGLSDELMNSLDTKAFYELVSFINSGGKKN